MINLLNVGVQGLKAHQEALSATSQNITNVNTPGYSRQVADFSARTSNFGTQMVTVDSITRQVDQYILQQVWSDSSAYSRAESIEGFTSQLDAYLSNESASLDSALTNFFSAMQSAVDSPSSLPVRQLLLSETDAFINRVQSLSDRLQQQESTLNSQMYSQVNQVSTLASNIAEMNARIQVEAGKGGSANELLDRRDELVRELSGMVDVQVIEQDGSSINVLVGRGVPLVVGTDANAMTLVKSDPDTGQQGLAVMIAGDARTVTGDISGGSLGGLLEYREQVLNPTIQEVDRLAMVVSEEMNRQHRLGMDLDGNLGKDLFTDINQGYTQSYSIQSNIAGVVPDLKVSDNGALENASYTITLADAGGGNYNYAVSYVDGSPLSPVVGGTVTAASSTISFKGLDVDLDLSQSGTLGNGTYTITAQAPSKTRIIPSANNSTASQAAEPWVEITDTSKLQASDYRLDFLSPTEVVVTRLSDGQESTYTYDPANDRSIELDDGLSVVLDTPAAGGTPVNFASGDSFLVRPTQHGASDMRLRLTNERELAFASPVKATADTNNTGFAEVEGLTVSDVTTRSFAAAPGTLTPPVEIVFTSATTYNVLDVTTPGAPKLIGAANQTYSSGDPIALDGYEITLSGQPANGDRFRIEYNSKTVDGKTTYGVADNTNAFALVDLQRNTGVRNGNGGVTYSEAYGHLLEGVGSRSRVAQIDVDASKTVLDQTIARRDSVSGVNLDEEAANLIKFEQAYNASAQVISVARSLFQTMLQTFS